MPPDGENGAVWTLPSPMSIVARTLDAPAVHTTHSLVEQCELPGDPRTQKKLVSSVVGHTKTDNHSHSVHTYGQVSVASFSIPSGVSLDRRRKPGNTPMKYILSVKLGTCLSGSVKIPFIAFFHSFWQSLLYKETLRIHLDATFLC